jgi:ribonuclease HII
MRGGEAHRQRFESLRAFDRSFDSRAWEEGRLAGVDEAGVGPLAGPVVAAAVVLPPDFDLPELFDSKRLSALQRDACARTIRARSIAIGVARVSVPRIDRLNILQASLLAHRRALAALGVVPSVVVVDGRHLPRLPPGWPEIRIEAVVEGDSRSLAVAAASVIAKTIRDRIMQRLDRRYPEYGFAQHKGYATSAHRQALRQHGLSPEHRRGFCGFLEAERLAGLQGSLSFADGA